MPVSRTLILALLALLAGFLFSCDEPKPRIPVPPTAPVDLRTFSITQTTIGLQWTDASVTESGFRVEFHEQGGEWEAVTEVGRNITTYTVTDLTQGTLYYFRVFAYNDEGDSAPSDELLVTTQSGSLPSPPDGVQAESLAATVVRVFWTDRGSADGFRVERRTAAADWAQIIETPDNVIEYIDSTVATETLYYYRVGAFNHVGVAWSPDSAEITTPAPGAPNPPSGLEVTVQVGIGITLSWNDNSLDETGFHIRRNISGLIPVIIDSVEAGVTTYDDELRDNVGVFSYWVRAFNEHGSSAWTSFVTVNYRFCSDGVLPLCLNNFWDYEVTEGQETYSIRRVIVEVAYPGGVDHYLEIEDRLPPTGTPDSVRYFRNFEDSGCHAVDYPLTPGSTSELLFQYPPASPGSPASRYSFHGDSVIVLSSGTTMTIGDSTYSNILGYQRFFRDSTRSIQYWISPHTLGIILEEEVESSSIVLSREIVAWEIHN